VPARQRAVGAEFRTGLTIMAVSPLPYVGAMSSTTTDDLSASADDALGDVLTRLVGPAAAPREAQADALRALLGGARVLCVQATGWGKSTVYFAATAALRRAGRGPVLVISPLLALMRDQTDAAERAGLRAATVNSANVDDWDEIFTSLAADAIDICFISPERLSSPSFAARVPELLGRVSLVVVDEAHCISDWGHDFRPDYRRIAKVIAESDARVLATTATANARVCADISAQLGEGAATFRGTLARPSLALHVVPDLDALSRYAWVAEALDTLDGTGIVYTLTVAEAERLAGFLAMSGHDVRAYSSALDPEERLVAEADLRDGRLKALVATSALGMGYDHPRLAFVIHVGSPSSPVSYYQQVGRAGRAIEHATVVLLPAETDERLWDYFATSSVPDPEQAAAVLRVLELHTASVVMLESETGFRRGRLELLLKILAVDGAVERSVDGWQATGQPWVFDAAHYRALVDQRQAEAEIMRAYAAGRGCLMAALQQALDDPGAGPCGRCSVCTGTLPAPGASASPDRVAAARQWLRALDVAIEPRKRWPSGVARSGAIVGAGEGRAVAFADDPAWNELLTRFHRGDIPIEPELIDGIVATLGRWRKTWPQRPTSVVAMPSRAHPQRVRSIAEAIATIGRLPIVDALTVFGPPPPTDTASAARARACFDTLAPTGIDLPAGPVLLVDDTYRTGWTMTVAAALLREAGADAVSPFVVHRLP